MKIGDRVRMLCDKFNFEMKLVTRGSVGVVVYSRPEFEGLFVASFSGVREEFYAREIGLLIEVFPDGVEPLPLESPESLPELPV